MIQERARNLGIGLAVLGAVLMLIGGMVHPSGFWESYHFGWFFWFQFSMGGMALLLLSRITGGNWAAFAEPIFVRSLRAILPWAVLFVPVLIFGFARLFPWAFPGAAAHDTLIAQKGYWLNRPFFTGRTIFYFIVWIGLSVFLTRQARKTIAPYSPEGSKMRYQNGGSLLLFCICMTFAAIDWLMSLDPHFFSTLYGAHWIVCEALCMLALSTLIVSQKWGSDASLAHPRFPIKTYYIPMMHDLATLTFAFVCIWSYLSFMHFLIIWSANLPEEVSWYVRRFNEGWGILAGILLLFGFILPFLILLSKKLKRNPKQIWKMAVWVLIIRVIDAFWLIMPSLRPHLEVRIADVGALVGFGGLWIFFVFAGPEARIGEEGQPQHA